MLSDKNESIRITGSRFVGGNQTRHEQREFTYSAAQNGRAKYGLFCKTRPPVSIVNEQVQKAEQEILFLCVQRVTW